MFPPVDQMIADILGWLHPPQSLHMWFDQESKQYAASVYGEIFKHAEFEKCLAGVWTYIDKKRGSQNV